MSAILCTDEDGHAGGGCLCGLSIDAGGTVVVVAMQLEGGGGSEVMKWKGGKPAESAYGSSDRAF